MTNTDLIIYGKKYEGATINDFRTDRTTLYANVSFPGQSRAIWVPIECISIDIETINK